jgi:ribosomal protein L29
MKKNTKTYQEKTVKELEKDNSILRLEIAKLQLSFKSNPPKDTNLLIKKKKQLAVLLTVLTEKKDIEKYQPKINQ